MTNAFNEHGAASSERRLGRLPVKSDTRALMLRRFALFPPAPIRTQFWRYRTAFAPRTFGNTQAGDCTRAKQAVAMQRMERLEVKRTAHITDDEVLRVYYEMTDRLYGGGDTGAYETDALSEWRKPDLTFRDSQGRPLTIDAYLRLDPKDQDELRGAMAAAGAHGIAICLNLPLAFQSQDMDWDVPEGQALVGDWLPGSWGGHSMWAHEYDELGIWLDHTWGRPTQRLTWRAAAAYLDEAHLVIDSLDYWRKAKPEAVEVLDLDGIKNAVNAVSSQKIK